MARHLSYAENREAQSADRDEARRCAVTQFAAEQARARVRRQLEVALVACLLVALAVCVAAHFIFGGRT